MAFLLGVFLFLFGIGVGSFLNVVVSRLAAKESFLKGRSHCDHCLRILDWFELVPLASFLALGGMCRSCAKPIPWRYFWVEGLTGILFGFLGLGVYYDFINLPFFASAVPLLGANAITLRLAIFVYYAFFISLAVAVSFYDFEHRIIPKSLILPIIVVGLIMQFAIIVITKEPKFFIQTIVASSAAFVFFWLIWFLSRGRAMGRGDADAAFAIALYLGPPLAIISFVFSFWLGALFGLVFVALHRLEWRSQIAFAPFLFSGAILSMIAPSYFLLLYPF